MGIWAECVPHDRMDEIYRALRSQGIQCEAGGPDGASFKVEVVCSDGGGSVRLRISSTRIIVGMTNVRATVEDALLVRRGPAGDRTWRQRRSDERLFTRIKTALEPFVEAEDEIVRAAMLAKAADATEADAIMSEWQRKYRKR